MNTGIDKFSNHLRTFCYITTKSAEIHSAFYSLSSRSEFAKEKLLGSSYFEGCSLSRRNCNAAIFWKLKKKYIFQVYINNKTQIDPVLDKVKAQLSEISGKVTAMIPQAKPAEKTE